MQNLKHCKGSYSKFFKVDFVQKKRIKAMPCELPIAGGYYIIIPNKHRIIFSYASNFE